MNLSELIVLCREDLDDLNAPYLVADESLTTYLNSAVNEACSRAFLLYDEATDETCSVTIDRGEQSCVVHPAVLRVESVRRTDGTPLYRMPGLPYLDTANVSWRDVAGVPTGFFVRRRELFVNYAPAASTDLILGVFRRPVSSERLADDADEPAIPEQFHEKLIHWALYRAYNRHDSELKSPENAAIQLSLFEAAFGRASSARAQVLNAELSSRATTKAAPYGGTRPFRRTTYW
jgi:hypothetical protein